MDDTCSKVMFSNIAVLAIDDFGPGVFTDFNNHVIINLYLVSLLAGAFMG